MSAELLLQEFDRIAEAPDAVAKLRRFVLDLAVRGKVTKRSPTDKPASQLLLRIERKMIESSDAGVRKRVQTPLPLDSTEDPFPIPNGWLWTRVRQVTRDRGQMVPTSEFSYIDVTAIDKEAGRIGETTVLAPSDAPSRARKIVRLGDVLYSCVRPYLLNIAVVDRAIEPPPIASTAFAVLDGMGFVEPRFLWTVLRSPYFVACVEKKMRGQAYPAINDSDFALLPVPLPPLAEQSRIVAKVDELMAVCDRLEAAQKERAVRRDVLRVTSLQRLTYMNAGAAISSANVRFFLDRPLRLINRPEHLAALRQTILDLAMSARLLAPRERKEYEPCRIGSVATLQNGYAFKSEWFSPVGTRLLRNVNVGHGNIDWIQQVCLPSEMAQEFERFLLMEGDIVVSLDRPFINTGTKVAIVRKQDVPCLLLQRVGRFQIDAERLDPNYLYLWANSPLFNRQIDPGRSNGVPHISSKQVEAAEIVLPGLAEQRRVVTKVAELMAVCDELETALASARVARGLVLEALLRQALDGAVVPRK